MTASRVRHSNPLIRDGFSLFSARVLRDTRLEPGARLVYADLVFRAFLDRDEEIEETAVAIAEGLGIGASTIRKHLAALRKYGLIETRRQGRGLPNTILVLDPRTLESSNLERSNPTSRTLESSVLSSSKREGRGAPATPRKRNPYFDALVAVFGEPSTKTEAGHYAKRANEIRDALSSLVVGYGDDVPGRAATAEVVEANVRARFDALVRAWSRERVTIDALVKHWTHAGAMLAGTDTGAGEKLDPGEAL